jgi:hypothetical protein
MTVSRPLTPSLTDDLERLDEVHVGRGSGTPQLLRDEMLIRQVHALERIVDELELISAHLTAASDS